MCENRTSYSPFRPRDDQKAFKKHFTNRDFCVLLLLLLVIKADKNCGNNMGIIEGNVPSSGSSDSDMSYVTDIILSMELEYAGYEAKPDGKLNLDEEPPQKRSLFGLSEKSVEVENIDLEGWTKKPPEEWNETDSKNWLLWAANQLRQSFGQISPDLAMPGNKLLCLTKQDFSEYDPLFGEKLYDLLHQGRDSNNNCQSSQDEEPLVFSDSTEEPQSGRPRLPKFIRHLLFDPNYLGVQWENREENSFRFVLPDEVAERWGQLDCNPKMNYQYFTRAIRYYYDKGIFAPHDRRWVYKFGENATKLLSGIDNFDIE